MMLMSWSSADRGLMCHLQSSLTKFMAPVVLVVLFCRSGGVINGIAWAADPPPGAEAAVHRVVTVQDQLTDIIRRIEGEKFLAGQGPEEEKAIRNGNVTRLQEIKFIYQRLLNTLKRNLSLGDDEAQLQKKMESGEVYALAGNRPYSLSYYDKLLDKAAAVQQKKIALNSSIKTSEVRLEENNKELKKSEQAWRRVKEEVESTMGEAAAANDPRYNQVQLEREAARAVLDLQEARRRGFFMELRLVDLRQKVAQRQLELIRKDLSFDSPALDREIARLAMQKSRLNERLQYILDEQKNIQGAWQADRATANSPATKGAMKALEVWRESYETVLQQTEDMTQLLNVQQKLWKIRYALVQGNVQAEKLEQWEQEASAARQQSQQAIGSFQVMQVNIQSRISALEKEQRRGDRLEVKYAGYHLNALNTIRDSGGDYLATLMATEQLANRLTGELVRQSKQVSLLDKAINTGSKLSDFWNFELWVIDDSGVTVRKVVSALVILILGIMVVKRVIRQLTSRLKRARLEASAVAAAEKLLLYTGIMLIVLLALRTVNIPLTAFTFLGGAIAIGVGFGAQNLINNFISGFIIMAERPIRIGDLIELDGRCVRVEEIGARCTKVKTGDNVHILVPNSSFLENNITNWTLSDQLIRAHVVVGVAYGSSVETVSELLLQAADQTEQVQKEPKPFVVFDDFGDNARTFVIYYWVVVKGVMEKRRIASTVRYQIDALFNQHGIIIAFPQRDIHVNSLQPLQVQLIAGRSKEN